MPATPEAKVRTRAFARVIGPFLVIVPGTLSLRAPDMGHLLTAFFQNEALVWITGGFLVFGGLLIIAHHQYWSSVSAVLISLFGWFLALRGVVLLAAPQIVERLGAQTSVAAVRIGFGLLLLAGVQLTFTGWVTGLSRRSPSI